MKIVCPECNSPIPPDKIKVAADMAYCSCCDQKFSMSVLLGARSTPGNFRSSFAPPGAGMKEWESGWKVWATTRSASAFFLVPFMCLWSFAISKFYIMQLCKSNLELSSLLLGIPFLLIAIYGSWMAAMFACGKVVVMMNHGEAKVFVGVGPLGWQRQFEWESIKTVKKVKTNIRYGRGNKFAVLLDGKVQIMFGNMLSTERRLYISQNLRKKVMGIKKKSQTYLANSALPNSQIE